MLKFKRPILAASLMPSNIPHTDENILSAMSKLQYPVLASEKIDGIRALRMNGTVLSRTLKVIPNRSICDRLKMLPGGFDGELWHPALSYNEIESIVMSHAHAISDLIKFYVLDVFNEERYQQRVQSITKWYESMDTSPNYHWTPPCRCTTPEELFTFFLDMETLGAEGICFRLPMSPYKQGRSTLDEQYLVKLARFIRTELKVVGFKEQFENGNPNQYNDIGYMKRATNNANMYGKNTLGAFVCVSKSECDILGPDIKKIENGSITFVNGNTWHVRPESIINVGTGIRMTNKLRKEIWLNQDKYLGKTIIVKHKPHNQKDKLRHSIFVGFRSSIDI